MFSSLLRHGFDGEWSMASSIIELRTGIGNGNNFTSNRRFGHVILSHTVAEKTTVREWLLCGFLVPPNVEWFLADCYCDGGISTSPENDQQA